MLFLLMVDIKIGAEGLTKKREKNAVFEFGRLKLRCRKIYKK
jgi:hypothetical protein